VRQLYVYLNFTLTVSTGHEYADRAGEIKGEEGFITP